MPKSVTSKRSIHKDPKASHLYTDDNPSTTLHGTGFKDAATAERTLTLVSKRSLLYQFQTINTMYHRAKGHPHKTAGMHDAMTIFQSWLDTYKEKKSELREFKILSKTTVEKYLKLAEEHNEDREGAGEDLIDLQFARMYVGLPPKKRLANTLVNDSRPGEEDWEIRRYRALCALVKDTYDESDLWVHPSKDAQQLTLHHLTMVMWAYSPAKSL